MKAIIVVALLYALTFDFAVCNTVHRKDIQAYQSDLQDGSNDSRDKRSIELLIGTAIAKGIELIIDQIRNSKSNKVQ
ncbi:hypothetical protein GJ496_012056 [Pomphorhynchus laevis]|nr:hypothetical protein GJ496_012056 [Pomphorhynchus laevis]